MKGLFPVLILILFSCNSDDPPGSNACTSNDPINEIPWLVNLKNSIDNCGCTTSVMKGKYALRPVFFVHMNDPFCNNGGPMDLYSCEGKRIVTIDVSDFTDLVQIETILYSCED